MTEAAAEASSEDVAEKDGGREGERDGETGELFWTNLLVASNAKIYDVTA